MLKPTPATKLIVYVNWLLFLTGCQNKNYDVPFPAGETEFAQPVSQPLIFSASKKIDWIITNSDSIKLPGVRKIDFTKIPAKPFYPDGFHPLLKPTEQKRFDINSLPDTVFEYDGLPAKKLRFKTSLLNLPLVIQSGLARLKEKTTMGLFEFKDQQGLPGSFVSAMLQDKAGIFWIATDKGLCRFDGEHLEIFSFVERIFNGTFATINKLLEDDNGRIWCKTDASGIYVLDWKAGLIRHIEMPVEFENYVEKISNNEMLKDSRGLIWVGTSVEGIYIIDQQKETIRQLPYLQNPGDKNAKEIIEDNEGRIWIGTQAGVSIIDLKTKSKHFITRKQGLNSENIKSLSKDSDGKIWIGSIADGVDIVNLKTASIDHAGRENGIYNSVSNFTEDQQKRMWMATDSGVYVFENALHKLRHITAKDGLNDNHLKTIVTDIKGQVWIGSAAGANLIDTKELAAEHYDENRGLSNSDIWSIIEDKQHRIWMGAAKTVDLIDPSAQTIRNIAEVLGFHTKSPETGYVLLLQDKQEKIWMEASEDAVILFDPEKNTSTYIREIKGESVTGMIEDSGGRIWTCGWRYIYIIDKEDKTFRHFEIDDGSQTNKAWALVEDRLGQIWLGTDNGVDIIDPVAGTMKHVIDEKNKTGNQVVNLLLDDKGRIWIAGFKGIAIADPAKETITHYTNEQGLCAPDVYTLYKYKEKIYAGTGDGLTVFTPNTQKGGPEWTLQSYGKGQGLISRNFNAGAALGVNDKLWWGVFPEVLTITNVPAEDNNPSSISITGINISDKPQSFIKRKNIQNSFSGSDTIWDIKGEKYYQANQLPEDTGYLQDNNIEWDSISGNFNLPANLTLPYDQNFISFHFTSGAFINRDKIRYRYILEGYDRKWSAITDKPYSSNYYNLAHGKYTFKVCSRGANGVWSKEASFSFTILPPWWQTWWAYLLYAALFAAIVWVVVRYRLRSLRAQNLRLEHKVVVRTNELRQSLEELKSTQTQLIQSEKMASLGELTAGIAHEIQNPLNFVNNFSEVNNELLQEMRTEIDKGNFDEAKVIAQDVIDNGEKINHHGKRADSIVKGMLQHSRTNTGQKELTDINALADEYLKLAYHGLRAKDKDFNVTIKTDFDESIGKINIIPQDIGRVLLNLYNNAFYAVKEKAASFEPLVSVQTKKLNNKIEIRVTDNGEGIPQNIVDKIFQPFFTTKPTGQGTGLGLSLAYDIVKAHGGEIKVETKEGKGSEFIVHLYAG